MARLNTRTSATPLHTTRSSTVDSLYRDPSVEPASRQDRSARNTTYSVISPAQSGVSDKENERPTTRLNSPTRTTKGKGLRTTSPRIPTPDSGPGHHGNKRRRTGDYAMRDSSVYEDGDSGSEDNQDDAQPSSESQDESEEDEELKFYNPNQDADVRRKLRARMRDHQRIVDENKDEMVKPNTMLLDALKTQNVLFGKVRQTADAALDSRFLVNASELAGKKLNNSLQGNSGVGIDLDQFVSKCIFFMKTGGHVAGEENAPTMHVGDEDDDVEDNGDGLDWALLGRQVCFSHNKRPPLSSYLLGPMSVEKRARKVTQRLVREQPKETVQPQEITDRDMQQSENSNLSNLVKGIKSRLEQHLNDGMTGVEDELNEIPEDEQDEDDQAAALRRFRVTIDSESSKVAVNLLDFAINPHNFGQTVENLFYISFLVREGNAMIIKDHEGLPLLIPATPHALSEQREQNVQKNQAVFSIDYPTWQMFIDAFDIRESIIPHREDEESNVTAGGWYAS